MLPLIARSSLVSIFSTSIEVDDEKLNVEDKGEFERRMLSFDIKKTSKDILIDQDVDYLILDFIDERFPLLKVGEAILTKSNYLVSTRFWNELDKSDVIEISRDEEASFELWSNSFLNLLSSLEDKKIILHKAFWADKFKNHDEDTILSFDEDRLDIVKRNNKFLSRLYDFVEKTCENLSIVEVDKDKRWSDFAHKWGVDYFHFGKEYYIELSEKLEAVIRR